MSKNINITMNVATAENGIIWKKLDEMDKIDVNYFNLWNLSCCWATEDNGNVPTDGAYIAFLPDGRFVKEVGSHKGTGFQYTVPMIRWGGKKPQWYAETLHVSGRCSEAAPENAIRVRMSDKNEFSGGWDQMYVWFIPTSEGMEKERK